MSIQAVQGLLVALGSAQASDEPATSEAADFLNILTALVTPNPLSLSTLYPELDQQTVEKSPTTLSSEMAGNYLGLGTQKWLMPTNPTVNMPGVQDTQATTFPAKDIKNELVKSEQTETQISDPELPLFQTPVAVSVISERPSTDQSRSQTERSEQQEQLEAIPLVHSQRGESTFVPKGKPVVDRPESLSLNNVVEEVHESIQAVVCKAESGKAELEHEMEVEVEIPLAESEMENQVIRPFVDHLPKELVQPRETKTIPVVEFKVPSQELTKELPRIIESQISNYHGKEISRDIIIHLEPKDLGKLIVKLTDQEGVITVKILTERTETRNLVETGLSSLRQSFSEQGIKYGRMDVELGGQYLQQQHQQQHSQPQMRWNQQGTFSSGQWQDGGYYPEDNTVITGGMLRSTGAVDYMA